MGGAPDTSYYLKKMLKKLKLLKINFILVGVL